MYLLKGLLILKVPEGMMATNAVKIHFVGTIQKHLYHKVYALARLARLARPPRARQARHPVTRGSGSRPIPPPTHTPNVTIAMGTVSPRDRRKCRSFATQAPQAPAFFLHPLCSLLQHVAGFNLFSEINHYTNDYALFTSYTFVVAVGYAFVLCFGFFFLS